MFYSITYRNLVKYWGVHPHLPHLWKVRQVPPQPHSIYGQNPPNSIWQPPLHITMENSEKLCLKWSEMQSCKTNVWSFGQKMAWGDTRVSTTASGSSTALAMNLGTWWLPYMKGVTVKAEILHRSQSWCNYFHSIEPHNTRSTHNALVLMNQSGATANSSRKSLLPLQLTLMKSPFFVSTKHLQKHKCYLFLPINVPFFGQICFVYWKATIFGKQIIFWDC